MSGIVCAIRGGAESKPTIDKAIRLAKSNLLPIYFLYVVDLDFLLRTESSRVHTITVEMEHLGDFILSSACDEASEEGVSASPNIRQGHVGEEIINLCKEVEADYVVVGRPLGEEEKDVFTHEHLNELFRRIEEETDAEIVLLDIQPDSE